MEALASDPCAAEEDDDDTSASGVFCLMRSERNSDWLLLPENTEVSIGRGVDVTYQLLSPSCPLMISRLHCTFSQRQDGRWAVTDRTSLNGVWVNGSRIPAGKAHPLRLGDAIQLGVAVVGTKAEFDYVLVRRPLGDLKAHLAGGPKEGAKKPKRKLVAEEVEPSTSRPKLYRCSAADTSFAKPCPLAPGKRQQETGPGGLDGLHTYSQNLLLLRERVDHTQRQVASLEGQPSRCEEQVRELHAQLEGLRAKMRRMETLERSFSEEQKTHQQEELMKKQLEEALQEQKKVMDELALSRRGFQEILSAKNKELEVTKEEKEKAKAQKEEVVSQVTEVLENELQCIICSELFIEAVILNCAHSFCAHCIQQWRQKKDECPICRRDIQSQTRCLALDNCITSMVENLSLDLKTRRQALIAQRKAAAAAAASKVMVIPDDDDSSSSSSRASVVSVDTDSSVRLDSSPTSDTDSDESSARSQD